MIPASTDKVLSACFEIFNLVEEYAPLFDNCFPVTPPVHGFAAGPPKIESCGDEGRHHLWHCPEVRG
jgi:hypothetical protein